MKTHIGINRDRTGGSESNYVPPRLLVLPPSTDDLRKIIRQLQKAIEEERYRREQTEERLLDFRQRSIKREKQFFRLIDMMSSRDKKIPIDGKEIEQLYNQILSNFETTNEETNRFMESKYENLRQAMERRITRILQTTQDEVSRNIRLSKETTQAIKREIQEALDQALVVEHDNIQFCKIRDTIKEENRILVEEKNLLLNQLIQKKQKLARQAEELKALNQIIQQAQSQTRNPWLQDQLFDSARLQPVDPLTHLKASGRLIWQRKGSINIRDGNMKIDLKTTSNFKPAFSKASQRRARSQFLTPRQQKLSSNDKQKGQTHSTLEPDTKIQCPFCQHHFSNEMVEGYQKTLEHLRNALRREKQKAKSYGASFSQMTQKNQQINQALSEIIEQSGKVPNNQKLEVLVQSQRLFKTLKLMKKRLGMLESPLMNCGWASAQESLQLQ